MKKKLKYHSLKVICISILLIGVLSCNKNVDEKLIDTNWSGKERTIEYDSITVTEKGPYGFSHYLSFNEDGTFRRTYESGTWEVNESELMVTSFEADCQSNYEIIKCTNKELVLESKKSSGSGFVTCGFDTDNEPKITEIYLRTN